MKFITLITGSPGHRGVTLEKTLASIRELNAHRSNQDVIWSSHLKIPKSTCTKFLRSLAAPIDAHLHDLDCSAARQSSQVIGGLSGLKSSDIVARVRSDFEIYSAEKLLGVVESHAPDFHEGKILLSKYGTADIRKTPQPFQFGDFFQVGLVERVRAYFSDPSNCCAKNCYLNSVPKSRSPEFVWSTNLYYEHHRRPSELSLRFHLDSADAQVTTFVFKHLDELGIKTPKIASRFSTVFYVNKSQTITTNQIAAFFSWFSAITSLRLLHPVYLIPKVKKFLGLDPIKSTFTGFNEA